MTDILFGDIMTITRLALPLALLTGCYRGSGISAEEVRTVDSFDQVTNTTSLDVVVLGGDTGATEVVVECDDNLIGYIETDVRGSELTIKIPNGVSISPRVVCEVQAFTPSLVGLRGTGSGNTWAEGDLADFSEALNTGSGRVEASGISGTSLSIDSTGSGGLAMSGATNFVDASSTGSGDIDGYNLTAQTAEVRNTGSGDILLTVMDSANVWITGSGDVEIWGGARATVTSTGSGSLIQH